MIMFFVGGFRASNAFPYVIEANDLEVEAFVEKHSSNAPWVSIMMALDFVMSDRDASTTTEDILQEVITRFVQYAIWIGCEKIRRCFNGCEDRYSGTPGLVCRYVYVEQ
jgi:hypothetical protein